jgi:hypothetical protein
MMDDDECGTVDGMICKGEPKYSEKICTIASLFTTNPTLPDTVSNPGRRRWKPACCELNANHPTRSSHLSFSEIPRQVSCIILNTALVEGEWSASRPSRFIPGGKRAPGTHWIGGWVGPRAGLDE